MDHLSRRRLFGALLGASSSLAVVPSLLAAGVADPQPAMAPPPLQPPIPPQSLVPGALKLFSEHFGWSASPILPGDAMLQLDHPVRQLSVGVRAPTPPLTPWEFQKFHLDVHAAMKNLGLKTRSFASREPALHFIRLPEPCGLVETEVMENKQHHSMRVIKHYSILDSMFDFRFDVAILSRDNSPPGRQLLFV